MDIAYYLSELLEQLGEVNVPGLGNFTRVKVDGYYNNDEGRFYPPTSKLEFTQQHTEDDVLTQYIGVKKRISLASSKYFTEKYITGLKQEVMSREIPFAELGSLYFDNGRILFRAAPAVADPAFYGYPKINLNKKSDQPVYHYEEPVVEHMITPEPEPVEDEIAAPVYEPFTEDDHLHEPAAHEPEVKEEPVYEQETHEEPVVYEHNTTVYEPEPVEEHNNYFAPQEEVIKPHTEDEDDFIFHSVNYPEQEEVVAGEEEEEEEEHRRGFLWLWITLIVLLIAGLGGLGWYYYQQQQKSAAVPVKKINATPSAAPKDTIDTAGNLPTVTPLIDTEVKTVSARPAQNTPAQTIDSTKKRYEIIVDEPKTQAKAEKLIKYYRSIGLPAHVVKDAPGKLKKISVGTYDSQAGVSSAMSDLIKTGKVSKDIWPLPINPKK